jgi:transcription initiation factor TFIID subunit 2
MSSTLVGGPFKLTHQKVSLRVDMQQRLLEGFTEMTLMPFHEKVDILKCHSRQCQIEKVLINGTECTYQLQDPLAEFVRGDAVPAASDDVEEKYADALSAANQGELIIQLPDSMNLFVLSTKDDDTQSEKKSTMEEIDRVDMNEESDVEDNEHRSKKENTSKYQTIHVRIDYKLIEPVAGVYFVLPDSHFYPDRLSYMYIWSSYNNARIWVPCFDYWQDTCNWELEFVVDKRYSVICNGELQEERMMDKEQTTQKHVIYRIDVPCSASQIAFALGPFMALQESYTESITYYTLPEHMMELNHTIEFMKKVSCNGRIFFSQMINWIVGVQI